MSKFDKAFEIVVGTEGGYVNDPADPGGETKYGISKRSYPKVDIKNLTLDDAKQIYRRDYWDKTQANTLPWPMCLYVFDCAVNQGVGVAVKMMQVAVGTDPDGIIGPRTLMCVENAGKEGEWTFMAMRAQRYFGTTNFNRFGKGWLKRLFHVVDKGAEYGG